MPLLNRVAHVAQRRARLQSVIAAQAGANLPAAYAITEVESWNIKEPVSGRSWSLVRLATRDGLEGWGEGKPITRESLRTLREILRNASAGAFEPLRLRLHGHPAAGAVNAAALDILAKASKAPVYQYLGGPTRFKVRAYTSLHGATDGQLVQALERGKNAGFRAFSVPVPQPPFRNSGKAFVLAAQQRFAALRRAGGENCDFILSGGGQLTPGDASLLAAAFERSHFMWFDEPCAASSLGPLRKISQESVTPVGFGRGATEAGFFQNLLREDAIDVCRPEIAIHGMSGCRRIAALAETYYVAVAPRHNEGPLTTVVAMHLAASLPNFVVQQVPYPDAAEDRAMRAALTGSSVEIVQDGFLPLIPRNGFGVTIERDALRKYGEVIA